MKRFAFKMQLKPGFEEEYERRHAALWPELRAQITASGGESCS
ncbi:MAG: L-rhamnose mutarotase, partial [Duncaniella sp.]|nr:L-rhamnose mutarotase [Duncaniella sp.]